MTGGTWSRSVLTVLDWCQVQVTVSTWLGYLSVTLTLSLPPASHLRVTGWTEWPVEKAPVRN